MKKFLLSMFPVIDILMMPIVYPAAWLLKIIRRVGMQRLPLCKNALMNVGVFPIRNHYYEPQFDNRYPKVDFTQDRYLPGISWNIPEQLETLDRFTFSLELADIPQWRLNSNEYHFNNGSFESGDAEYWYSLIRAIKPKRIIEIGSGYSTLIAIKAIECNQKNDPNYECEHICIEPFEMPWLEQTGVSVIRKKGSSGFEG